MPLQMPSPPSGSLVSDAAAWSHWANAARFELERFAREVDGSGVNSDALHVLNLNFAPNAAATGINGGLRIINSGNLDSGLNPAAGNTIAISAFIDNVNGRGASGTLALPQLIEAANFLVDQQPTSAGGSVSQVQAVEVDITASFAPLHPDDPFNGANPFPGVYGVVVTAEENLTSAPNRPMSAFLANSANAASNVDWHAFGLTLTRIWYDGIRLENYPGDTIDSFTHAAIADHSNSARVLDVAGFHAAAIIDLGSVTAMGAAFITAPAGFNASLITKNFADHNLLIGIDSGNSAPEFSILSFLDRGMEKWQIAKADTNALDIINKDTGTTVLQFNADDSMSVNGTAAVTFTGSPTASFQVINGIVVHQ